MRKKQETEIKMTTSDNSFAAKINNLIAFNDEQGIILKDANISSMDVVTSVKEGIDTRIAVFDGNTKNIKDGGLSIAEVITNIPITFLSSTDPYIVQDGDVMIIASDAVQITLPPVNSNIGRQLIFKHQNYQKSGITINTTGLDDIDGLQTMILEGGGHLHLVASDINNGKWNIIASSQNEESLNPVFETITCSMSTSTLQDTTINGSLSVNNISCNGIGKLDYLESHSVIVKGQVIAADFITQGGLVAEGTVSAGTLTSKGDITAASDITSMRLNLTVNDTTHLTLEPNIAQKNDLTLILPSDAGKANQVLSTDGQGNLSWVDSNIVINSSTAGKNILNGTTGVVIKTSAITPDSIVSITRNVRLGVPQMVTKTGNLIVGSIMDGVSFIVYSTTENDTDNFDWFILNPKI